MRIGRAEPAQEETFATATDEEKHASDNNGNGPNKGRRFQQVQEIIGQKIDVEGIGVSVEIVETE
jgi:hypothetical protein